MATIDEVSDNPSQDTAIDGETQEFRQNFEDSPEQRIAPVRLWEVAFGLVTICLWLTFFCAGILVGSQPSREIIGNATAHSATEVFWAWMVVLPTYTITNVGLLACFSSVAGEFSRRSRSTEIARIRDSTASQTGSLNRVAASYAAATMRGFVIYLLIASGLLLVTTEAISEASQDQYVRLAASISVISFVAGYDSSVFKAALDRIVSLISQTNTRSRR